jgi:anti-sigma B factor antagonist
MEIQRYNGTLSVHAVRELSAANARSFRNEVCAMLAPELESIEIDLEQTTMVDSCGLGALVSLYRAALQRNRNGGVRIRLLNPQPPVQQLFELTRLHHLFEIVPPAGGAVPGPAAIPQPVSPAQSG